MRVDEEITRFIVFLEGTVTNLAILLVLYPVSIFLSLPTGHGKYGTATVSTSQLSLSFFINIPRFPAGQYF